MSICLSMVPSPYRTKVGLCIEYLSIVNVPIIRSKTQSIWIRSLRAIEQICISTRWINGNDNCWHPEIKRKKKIMQYTKETYWTSNLPDSSHRRGKAIVVGSTIAETIAIQNITCLVLRVIWYTMLFIVYLVNLITSQGIENWKCETCFIC